MSGAAIETLDLTKYYGASRGLEGLDLRVERGEVFGFLGPNGAGKTTTIRLLLDLIRPTRGAAKVCGLNSQADSMEVRRCCGYLPGDLRLPRRPTAREYLRHLSRLRGAVSEDRVEALADRLGLSLERRIGELSKGNRQKVGIVAAFVHDPEVLVLDEPTSGLDPLRQRDVQELMRERASAGRTVFLSSHALDQVEHVADRVAIIRGGRLVAIEGVAALKRRATRTVEVRFAGTAPANGFRQIDGVREVDSTDGRVRLRVEGSMDALVKELARYPVQTLTSEEPELDEIFLSYYRGSDAD